MDFEEHVDVHALFLHFNDRYFSGLLSACEVKWSSRMTLCAGLCSYEGHGGLCSIRLSSSLLQYRPQSDIINTLLHEMIHAYLFVTDGNTDHDGHGDAFHYHMDRINRDAGTEITVYHSFRDEVDSFRKHVWQCDGPCRHRPPYYGLVKRSMNRAPQPADSWFARHQSECGGTFTKVSEPEKVVKKRKPAATKEDKVKKKTREKEIGGSGKDQRQLPIDAFFDKQQGTMKSQSQVIDLTATGDTSSEFVDCPVCLDPVMLSQMDQHLELCLI
jgi:predicted SprT family Zn-dependent metalloprotease